ncbi:MAG TPA: GNAT family N-acetyltransferase [Cyanobacteria bacterium UBA11049]|nr:GNAT family N-acetyltransferase [Cyanobacteria bacterium UBA11049]
MSEKIEFSIYQSKYQTQVIELILKIQRNEFGLPITLDEQPDLLIIPTFYQQGNGNFWLALDGNKVIGTIAAIDIGYNQLALRKMFVDVNYRGDSLGVARNLMFYLRNWSKLKNIRAVYLGTVDKFKAAQKFYQKNGFISIGKFDLPADFPIMEGDNIFYRLSLHEQDKISTTNKVNLAQ